MTTQSERMDALEGLDVRAYNALHKIGCRTVADVCNVTERDLLNIHGVGRLTLNNIKGTLAKEGLELRD